MKYLIILKKNIEYVLNIIIEYPYRHLGKGKVALELLCKQAKESGLRFYVMILKQIILPKNFFLDLGFKEVWAREKYYYVEKRFRIGCFFLGIYILLYA